MSASDGSVSQPGPVMPMAARASLMGPPNGSISTLKRMPTPIVLTSTGKKTVARRNPRPMICELRKTPSSRPSTTLSPR